MRDFRLSLVKRVVSKPAKKQAIASGMILGNIFGSGDSVAVMGDYTKIYGMIREAGKNHPITLDVEGQEYYVLIREIEQSTLTQKVHHISFQVVNKSEVISAEVPVHLVGEAPGVRFGLILVTVSHNLTVEAVPTKLPENIEVDISGLVEDGDLIRVSDLRLDEEVKIVQEPETVIVQLEAPKEEIVEEPEEVLEEGEAGAVEGEAGAESETEAGTSEEQKTEGAKGDGGSK